MRKIGSLVAIAVVLNVGLGCSSSSSSGGAGIGGGGPTCGTGLTCTWLAPATGGWRVAVDAASAYFTHDAGVTRVDLADGKILQLVTGISANQIAIDDTTVYYTVDADHVNSKVFSVPKAGGPPTLIAEHQLTPYSIVVADGALFWITFGTYDASQDDGTLMRYDLTTKTTKSVASSIRRGAAVYATNGIVYFASSGSVTPGRDGALWKAPTSADGAMSGATEIVSGFSAPVFLGADGTGLYVGHESTSNGSANAGTQIDHLSQPTDSYDSYKRVQAIPEDIAFMAVAADGGALVVSETTGVVLDLGSGGILGDKGTTLLSAGDPRGLALDSGHVYVVDHNSGLWSVTRH